MLALQQFLERGSPRIVAKSNERSRQEFLLLKDTEQHQTLVIPLRPVLLHLFYD